jgi:hypothetical protein
VAHILGVGESTLKIWPMIVIKWPFQYIFDKVLEWNYVNLLWVVKYAQLAMPYNNHQ